MEHDAELDRLGMVQDIAFQEKQDAHYIRQQAYEEREAARKKLDSIGEIKRSAREEQDRTWHHYQAVRGRHKPLINKLNDMQCRAYEKMQSSFASAATAYYNYDKVRSKSHATDGHLHKEESRAYVKERRRLVGEIRSARASHEVAKQSFVQAKTDFPPAKQRYDAAKAAFNQADSDFQEAKEAHQAAENAFQARLELIKAARAEERRKIAEEAGVPPRYLNEIWIKQDADGTVNIYFGGLEKPDGPGHGHYSVAPDGVVVYTRLPFDRHGSHNYTNNYRHYRHLIEEENKQAEFGFPCKYNGYNAYAESRITDGQEKPKIDLYYGPRSAFGPGSRHAVAYRDSPLVFVSDVLQ